MQDLHELNWGNQSTKHEYLWTPYYMACMIKGILLKPNLHKICIKL